MLSLKLNFQLSFVISFENSHTVSEVWDPSYASDPKINAAYAKSVSSGAWNFWGGQTNWVQNCKPGGFNWSGYASGSLSGSGVTYDVDTIQSNCAISP